MSKILIPEEQSIYPNPNEHINFEFNNSIEEYRTSRYLNQILKVFGPDIVLWGLNLEEVEYNDNVELTFNNGVLIQDSTLIKILYSFSKSINVTSDLYSEYTDTDTGKIVPDSNYAFVVYTDFKFPSVTETPSANPLSFNVNIGLLDQVTNTLYNGNPNTASVVTLDDTKNRIIVYSASIDSPHHLHDYINIDGDTYKVRGTKTDLHVFDYESFEFDGGELNLC